MKILLIDPIGQILGYYDYLIGVELTRRGHQVILATTQNAYARKQGKVPFEVLSLFKRTDQIHGKLNKGIKYIISLWQVLKLISGNGTQLLCFQYPIFPPLDFLFVHACKARGKKVVLFAHDILPLDQKLYHKMLYPLLYRAADKLVVFAEVNRNMIVRDLGLKHEKVFLSSLGNFLHVETNSWTRARAREIMGVPETAKVILFFGQLKKTKGIEHLINAFAEVIQKELEAMLVIAGKPSGVTVSFLEKLIQYHSIQDRVILDAHYIPDEEVAKYFNCADLVALPYTEVYQSAVLMLACSFGKPVVATAVGGIPEVIKDGQTGYLVPPSDEKKMASAIIKALKYPDTSSRMGKEAQKMMQLKFSWEQCIKKLEDIFAKI